MTAFDDSSLENRDALASADPILRRIRQPTVGGQADELVAIMINGERAVAVGTGQDFQQLRGQFDGHQLPPPAHRDRRPLRADQT